MSNLFNSINSFVSLVEASPTISSIAQANLFITKNADFFSELYSKLKDYSAAPSSISDDDDYVIIEPDSAPENNPHFNCDDDELAPSIYQSKCPFPDQNPQSDHASFLSSVADDDDPNPHDSSLIRDFLNSGK